MIVSVRACRTAILLAIVSSIAAMPATAQVARQSFPISFGSGAITGTLPFDEPFILTSPAGPTLLEVRLWVGSELSVDDCVRLVPASEFGARATRRTDASIRSAENFPELFAAATNVDTLVAQSERQKKIAVSRKSSPEARKAATEEMQRLALIIAGARAAERMLEIRITPSAVWLRNGMDSLNTLALEVGSIKPNRDYTACLNLVRTPTDKEAKDFAVTAQEKLLTSVKKFMKADLLAPTARLDAIQMLLIESLPRNPGVIVEINSLSVLARIPGETDADKRKRLSAFNDFWSRSAQFYLAREAEIPTTNGDAALLANRLKAIQWSTLGSLQRVADDSTTIKAHSTTFIRPAQIASRIDLLSQGAGGDPFFRKVSLGLAALNDQSSDLRDRDLSDKWSAEDLRTYDDSLKLTGELLSELIDFAAYAKTRPELLKQAAVTPGDISAVVAQLVTAIKFVTLERNDLTVLGNSLTALTKEVTAIVKQVKTYDVDRIALRSTTSTTFQARAKMYISLDAGLLSGNEVREIVPYFGVNLYARPVNKNAPLAGCWCTWSRLALTLGVTAASVKQEGRINDLFNSHAVMLGVGARVTDYWRVSVGGLAVKYFPNGPLQRSQITASLVFASSLDLDVLSGLGVVATFLVPGLK